MKHDVFRYLSRRLLAVGAFVFLLFAGTVAALCVATARAGGDALAPGVLGVGTLLALLALAIFWVLLPFSRVEKQNRMFLSGYAPIGSAQEKEVFFSPADRQMWESLAGLLDSSELMKLNKRQAQYLALQNQINPHFLYNTLDAIIWLAEADEKEQVVRMVTSLSDFFRTTLSKGRDYVSLRDEETHIKSYLQIQQFRYRDILEYEIRIPEELYDCCILKLTLQPLVENALYHGLKNKRRLGRILVSAERAGDKVVLRVYDDGKGLTAERLAYVRKLIRGELEDYDSPSGFGLFNVEQRIRLNYGTAYGIELNSVYGEWTEVTVTIPVVKK